MSTKLPKITVGDVQQLAAAKVFDRGSSYFRSGALIDPIRQGTELRAYCEGSSYQPYRVTATLGPDGIQHTSCTCPYDWGGICKHVVTLLLAWVEQPETFQEIPPLDDLLVNRSKEELAEIIKEMLKREPDLARLLELPTQPDRSSPLNLDAFRRQIEYAVRQYDHYDYPNAQGVARELDHLVGNADGFREAGDWKSAGEIYALILSEVVSQYDELYDEDGDVAIQLQSCAEGLDNCFAAGSPDDDSRERWLTALLEAELKDIEMGGIDLATPAGDVLVENATDAEWTWIEARVRAAINQQTGRFSDWPKEALMGLLIHRLELKGRDNEVDDLILRQGSPRQQAFLLVDRGQFEQAIDVANQHFVGLPGLIIDFADALVEAGANEAAVAFMTAQLGQDNRQTTYLEWLAKHAQETGDVKVALKLWRQKLEMRPTLETYQAVKNVAEMLGQLPEVRREALNALEKEQAWSVLIDIALDEDDVGRALNLLPKLTGWHSQNYALKVAAAAETNFPQQAIRIYTRQVESLIGQRGRENYRSAAGLLKRVKALFRQQQDEAAWQELIQETRHDHSNLPALRDELNKAGL